MTDATSLESTVSIASPAVGQKELRRIQDVLQSGQLSGGDEVDMFGAEFGAYCDVSHGVPTCNGTTALHAALAALELGPGDTVVTTPFSFVATANAVRHVGARPVFADIDPETYNLDPDSVAAVADRENGIDAILAVHLYGCPAPMDELQAIADRHDAAVIEDCAQAHGAIYHGEPVGSLGDVGCFSFYPTKNMTTGEGGMVVTDDDDLADRLWSFIDHGRGEHGHERLGHNFRMTDICAAIGRVQLERLDEFIAARRTHASRFLDALADSEIIGPVTPDSCQHAYHQFTVRCARRDELATHLERHGVDSAVYYPTPIHEEPAYDDIDATLPVAERATREVLSVPVHPDLSPREVRTVALALTEF